MSIQYFIKEEFESNNINLKLIEDFGLSDEWSPKVYFNCVDQCYYARGNWAGPKCDILRYIKIDFIDIDEWISNMRETLKQK
jgi:hypothetical protein